MTSRISAILNKIHDVDEVNSLLVPVAFSAFTVSAHVVTHSTIALSGHGPFSNRHEIVGVGIAAC